jgi:hypothetical protein
LEQKNMNADMERIIDKIKKCLALSQSDNPNEAASALRQAQALMRKHGVDEVAMAGAEIGDAEVEAKSANTRRPPGWEAFLVMLVGDAFGCEVLVQFGTLQPNGRRGRAGYRYIGVTANAMTAAYTLAVLLRQLRKCRSQHVSALRAEATLEGWRPTAAEERSAGDAYCVGWVTEVRGLVTRFANPAAVDAAIKQRVADATQGRVSKLTKARIEDFDQGSIRAGAEAAKDVSLHRPVEQSTEKPALGFRAAS